MKANYRLTVWALTLLALATNVACSNSSGSGGGSASAASVLSVTPAQGTVPASGSLLITPSGGTAPYTFTLQSAIGGSLSALSGTSTTFIAGTSGGLVYIIVTDSANQSVQASVTVTGLSVTPITASAAPGGTVSYIVSGGTAPYTYSSTGGTFSGTIFTVSSSAANGSTISVLIGDSAGHSVTATVTVSGTVASSSSCAGNYNLNLDGYPGTLQITEDSSGNIAGALAVTGYGYPSYIYGTCSAGTINFTDSYNQAHYTATYFANPSTGRNVMTGSWTDTTGTYSWFATQ